MPCSSKLHLLGRAAVTGPIASVHDRPILLLSLVLELRSIPICQHPPLPTATWRNLFLKAAAIHRFLQLHQLLTFCPRHSRSCCLHKAESMTYMSRSWIYGMLTHLQAYAFTPFEIQDHFTTRHGQCYLHRRSPRSCWAS